MKEEVIGIFSPDGERIEPIFKYDHFIDGTNTVHTVYIRGGSFDIPASDFASLMHNKRRDMYLHLAYDRMVLLKKAKITKIMRCPDEDTYRITCTDFIEYCTKTEDLSE